MNKLDIDNQGNIIILNTEKSSDISFFLEEFFDNRLNKLKEDIEVCQDPRKKNLLIQFAEKYDKGELDFISDYWQNEETIEYNSTSPSFEFGYNRDGTGEFTAHDVNAVHSGFWYAANDLDKEIKNIAQYKHNYEGFIIASEKIDIVISIIKSAPDYKSATLGLQDLGLTRLQAEAVMSSRLDRLTWYESKYLQDRIACCEKLSIILKSILNVNEIYNLNEKDFDKTFYAAQLQKSPMFQLSLSSKELFHSNFLYWIWKNSPELFKNVIDELYKSVGKESPTKSWPDEFVVTREHKHFDLSVFSKDNDKNEKILLVIENKVKSIPYQSQLDAYLKKSSKADHLLLSLIGNDFPEYKKISTAWTTVSYRDMAKALSNIANKKWGYMYDIIWDYVKYITILDRFAEEWKKNANATSEKYLYGDNIYKDLRISDIYQKILFSQILSRITDSFKSDQIEFNWEYIFNDNNISKCGADTLYVNSGLTNSTGFLEVKVKIEPDIAILVQVQGNQYRRCIEFSNKQEKKWPSLKYNINWLRKKAPDKIKQFFALEEGEKPEIPYPVSIGTGSPYITYKRNDEDSREIQNGFCKYGNCFIYQYLKIDNKLIDDIVKAVVEDINKFRSIISKNNAD